LRRDLLAGSVRGWCRHAQWVAPFSSLGSSGRCNVNGQVDVAAGGQSEVPTPSLSFSGVVVRGVLLSVVSSVAQGVGLAGGSHLARVGVGVKDQLIHGTSGRRRGRAKRFRTGSAAESAYPNDLWRADHTELETWWCWTRRSSRPRPWPTVIRGDQSRAVAGYTVFLGDPTALQTALACDKRPTAHPLSARRRVPGTVRRGGSTARAGGVTLTSRPGVRARSPVVSPPGVSQP